MKSRAASLALVAALVSSCGDDAPTAPVTAGATLRTCGVSRASSTPVARTRFPLGSAYWLPAGTTWTLAASPAGNMNVPFVDEASQRQGFVPHVAGAHRFTGADGRTVQVSALDGGTLGFHNVNYYPTRAMAADDSRLWVAAVLRPEVVELDRTTLTPRRTFPVGGWPVAVASVPGRMQLIVAARADDSLTVVDLTTGRPVRSIWVGDEVSNVIVTPDGRTALALAPVDRKVVFVDLVAQRVVGSVGVGVDPTHVVLSADGARAWVAGRRTGNATDNAATDPSGDDLSEIDIARRAITRRVRNVGATLGGLALSADGARLYATGVREDNAVTLADDESTSFRHSVMEYDLTGADIREARVVDVTRYPSGSGSVEVGPRDVPGGDRELALRRAVSLQGAAVVGDELWVLSEASDMLLRLSRDTLREVGRVEVPGRPRALLTTDGRAWAFGHQALTVTELSANAAARRSMPIARDPRPELVAAGQRFFTGTGVRVPMTTNTIPGDRWGCNTCHADGLSDRIVWQAGPNRMHRNASRPFTQLEGTYPLGWQGYLSDIRNYAYTVTTNVGLYTPTQQQVDALAAYLASLAPPPPANSLTERDGGHSAAGCEGAAVYETHCAGCHAGPMTTSRDRIEQSLGDNTRADTPSLVGSYRNETWFRKNTASSLQDAVGQMARWSGVTLSPGELTSLTRYVAELTGRDFYLLTESPRRELALPAGGDINLIFAAPVFDGADNLARVRLVDANNARIAARVTASGRVVTVTPAAALPFDAAVRVVVDRGFEAQSETRTAAPIEVAYRTVVRPALRMEGDYRIDLNLPPLPGTPPGMGLYITFNARTDTTGAVPFEVRYVVSQYRFRAIGTVSGRRLWLPPMPLPVGTATADGFSGFTADLTDADNDGVADGITAPVGFTLSGPGFEFPELGWSMRRMP